MKTTLIFGAGAIGTLLGGLLANAGHQVTLIGRKWNIDGIKNQGIRISGKWGEHQTKPLPAYESIDHIPNHSRQFDQIIITVKAFDTQQAIQSCASVISDDSLVISCQNGYGNCQTIAEAIGWERTLGARVITGVELPQPGIIQVNVHADAIRLGHYNRQFPLDRIDSITQTMREANIPVESTESLEQYIWAKILYNSALNPLGALLNATYGELADTQSTRSTMDQIIEEAFQVTQKCGIKQFWPSADEYRDAFYNQMVPSTAAHYPSMLRDIEKNRRTEIDALNGAIVEFGQQNNVPTPVNQTLVALLKFRELKTD